MRPFMPTLSGQVITGYDAKPMERPMHLGYWSEPPAWTMEIDAGAFETARAALIERVTDLVQPSPDMQLLDAGCAPSGFLEAFATRAPGMALTGLNADWRQLQACKRLDLGNSSLTLTEADACDLPFQDSCFDRVVCAETMIHLRSRAAFFTEARRVLRPDGTLVISDLAVQAPRYAAPWDKTVMERALQMGYGPWPEVWVKPEGLVEIARQAGMRLVASRNWTVHTLPSYRLATPGNEAVPGWNPSAGEVMRWLHMNGWLNYVAMVFQRA